MDLLLRCAGFARSSTSQSSIEDWIGSYNIVDYQLTSFLQRQKARKQKSLTT